MKLPVAPLQRAALGVAACAFVAASVSAVAVVTQPASATASDGYQTDMTFERPASHVAPTTATSEPTTLVTMAQETFGAPERAEKAATRAEGAADRAEVAATKAETAVTATTAVPTTTTTIGDAMVLVAVPHSTTVTIPPTTTTTLARKWVEVARYTPVPDAAGAPAQIHVELQTGKLRVNGLLAPRGMNPGYQHIAVWLGTDPVPTQACPPSAENTGDVIAFLPASSNCPVWDVWPTGPQTISVGEYGSGGWHAPDGTYQSVIIIEEYQ